jgi:hypothetical protein
MKLGTSVFNKFQLTLWLIRQQEEMLALCMHYVSTSLKQEHMYLPH